MLPETKEGCAEVGYFTLGKGIGEPKIGNVWQNTLKSNKISRRLTSENIEYNEQGGRAPEPG